MSGPRRPPARSGGAYAVPGDVAVSVDGEVVYLARLPGGPILVLDGSAGSIWREATTAPADGWVARVAAAFGVGEADVSPDVDAFVVDLQARGLLVPADPA